MNKRLKIALVVLVLVGVGFFVRATDWRAILEAVRQVGYYFLFLLFVTFVSAWMAVLAWRFCLPKERVRVSGWKLFWVRLIGENIAILNPTSVIGGEAAKIYMLRDLGIPQRQALHSIVLSRAIMIISQIVMLSIATIGFLSLTSHSFSWPGLDVRWLLVLVAVAVVVGYLPRSRLFRGKIKKLIHWLGLLETYQKTRHYVATLWQELHDFRRGNQQAMVLSFLFCCLHWIVGSLEFYFILLFLGIKTTVIKALLVDMGVIVFKTVGGFVPGQIGVEEYGNKVMLSIIGVAGSTTWITVSILRRARQLFWILLGLLMYVVFFRRQNAYFQQ